MSKRRANNDLNRFNWDHDDVDDEDQTGIGTEFKKASEDILSRRVIRKAKRTLHTQGGGGEQDEPKVSLFSSFQGFKKPEVTAVAAAAPLTTTGASASFSFLEKLNEPQQIKRPKTDQNVRLAKIKGLNESVTRWITDHVRTNPLCDLTPIFDDYRKYWSEIEAEDNKTSDETGPEKVSIPSLTSTETIKPLFTFPTAQPSLTTTQTVASSLATTTPFTFNLMPTSSSSFTFKPQTNGSDGQEQQTGDTNDDEDNQPPPIEDSFDDIKEEGSIFSIKCKVFFMENAVFQDKGICYAFLKPTNSKLQLIARLNNKLGTIVVNTVLTKTMAATIQKRNEKNVLITCVPNAAQAQNPLPVLFKVKSATEADRFIKTLNDNLN